MEERQGFHCFSMRSIMYRNWICFGVRKGNRCFLTTKEGSVRDRYPLTESFFVAADSPIPEKISGPNTFLTVFPYS